MTEVTRDERDYQLSRIVSKERHERFVAAARRRKTWRRWTLPLAAIGVYLIANWITEADPYTNWWYGAIGFALIMPYVVGGFGDWSL